MMDLVGKVFGKLTVKAFSERTSNRRYYWICKCECGTLRAYRQDHLRSGLSRSCGCLIREVLAARNYRHGEASSETKTPEYRSWASAINRCHNPKNKAFARYGARGIYVCDRWRNSFTSFLADMGRRAEPSLSLDRINNDGPYSPNNCRWATDKQQCQNRRPRRKATNKTSNGEEKITRQPNIGAG